MTIQGLAFGLHDPCLSFPRGICRHPEVTMMMMMILLVVMVALMMIKQCTAALASLAK